MNKGFASSLQVWPDDKGGFRYSVTYSQGIDQGWAPTEEGAWEKIHKILRLHEPARRRTTEIN